MQMTLILNKPYLLPGAARAPAARPATARQRANSHRRRIRWRRPALNQAEELQEWDIVLFEAQGGAALGRVSQAAGGSGELCIEPLEEDATNGVWIVGHGSERHIPRAAVRRTVQADYLQLMDPDRASNPHGEHALEAYRLLEPVAEALAALSGGSSGSGSSGSGGGCGGGGGGGGAAGGPA